MTFDLQFIPNTLPEREINIRDVSIAVGLVLVPSVIKFKVNLQCKCIVSEHMVNIRADPDLSRLWPVNLKD